MEASKLIINPDHLRFKPMSRGKKANLRKENIKALIRSKPAGTRLTIRDFQACTGMVSSGTYGLVERMVERGEIAKILLPGRTSSYSYSVNEDVKVKPTEVVESERDVDVPEFRAGTVDEMSAVETEDPRIEVSHNTTLEDMAKDFAWETNSDSLREFIKWHDLKAKYDL